MTEDSVCPSDGELHGFVNGSLAEDAAIAIQTHLATCEKCRFRANQVRSGGKHALIERPSRSAWSKTTLAGGRPTGDRATAEALADVQVMLQPSSTAEYLGRVGVYDIASVLGRGGMGIVFRAFDTALHRTVAIKVLSPQLATSPRARRRFLREARAAAGINHPNVVTIHSVDEQGGMPYLVMEYVSGRSLRERLKISPPLAPISILRISVQIADGLAAAHRHGIIHRDIKPGNILLEEGVERVKISDFGLALVALDLAHLTTAGQTVGTPGYMSPEQVTGKSIDSRNDLFGLGCVMYAMVTGSSPFCGRHPMEIAHRIVEFKPTPLHKKVPSVPKSFSDVVNRLLEKDPNRRYQTAEEVGDLLQRQLAAARGETSDTLRKATVISRRPKAARWTGTVAAVCGVLLAVAALAMFLLPDGSDRQWPAITPPAKPEERTVAERVGGVLTVGQSGEAKYRSITAALDRAAAGAIIRVLDAAEYREAIRLTDPVHNNVTLESLQGALLVPPSGADAALTILAVTGVTVRGFRIQLEKQQFAVYIEGEAEGLLLEQLQCMQPGDTTFANIYVARGARGSAGNPIRIRGCVFDSAAMGIVVQGEKGKPAAFVEIQDNRFRGLGTHVLIMGTVHDVAVQGNLFFGKGLGLSFAEDEPSRVIRIGNNTFFDAPQWIGISGAELADDVDIYNNLILGGRSIGEIEWLRELAARWSFRNNVWENHPGMDGAAASVVAEVVEQVQLTSRITDDVNYLRPGADSALATAGAGGDLPEYVGALPPVSNKM